MSSTAFYNPDPYKSSISDMYRSHMYSPSSIIQICSSDNSSEHSTFLSSIDEEVNSLIFKTSNITKVSDLLKEKIEFESTYKISSHDFYTAWKNGASFRSKDFDRWSRICQILSYVSSV